MEWIGSILSGLSWMSWFVCMGLTLWGGYYLAIGLMSWRKTLDYSWHPARTRFAVLIAARNEELVIGSLIHSLLAQDYPADLYDIWVIPNHCSDRTAEVAEQFGAKVLECTVRVKNKGEVLRFAYNRLHGRRYDAYCVFDADNIADRRFLSEMNNAYLAGAKAAQGYRDSKNPYDTTVSGCYSIYYWMMNRFYNGGRAGLGLSAMVNGTGFMISARTLENLGGWHTQTISEDLEITAQMILSGEKIFWVPKAITYDEQPLDYAQSVKQRRRWTCGTLQVAEEYLGKTGRAIQTSNRLWSLGDLGATLLIPGYQMAALAGMLVSSFAACMNCHRLGQVPAAFLGAAALQLMMTALGSTLAAALVLTVERKWDKRLGKALLVYWLFLLSWVPITICSFLKQTSEWEEIRHTRNVVPENILKS